MPAAYVIVDVKITDPQRYQQYMASAPASVHAFGGEYVVRGGRHQRLEGHWQPARVAMLKFPSFEQAQAWYASEQYRAAREHRAGATEYFNMVVVEALAAPV